ncbi:hypothetical protein [Maridesulfovibrio sp. FT414]|uniref:hypothetical protein n=1 Tax=Maridesulfovibrio sp. FT414 TaxID=2979469 RepID=UPI003D802EDF
MVNRISDKFMSSSKEILDGDSVMKAELERVMGQVADSLVRDKYVREGAVVNKETEGSEKDHA